MIEVLKYVYMTNLLIVFYIYQVNESILSISPPLNKVDSKLAVWYVFRRKI